MPVKLHLQSSNGISHSSNTILLFHSNSYLKLLNFFHSMDWMNSSLNGYLPNGCFLCRSKMAITVRPSFKVIRYQMFKSYKSQTLFSCFSHLLPIVIDFFKITSKAIITTSVKPNFKIIRQDQPLSHVIFSRYVLAKGLSSLTQ